MHRFLGYGAACAILAVVLLGSGGCSKHEEPAPVAAMPAPPPPPPLPPPAPSADDLLQAQLTQLGASVSNGTWAITLSSAKFRNGQVTFSPEEAATLAKVGILKESPHLRVQIENYLDGRGAKTRLRKVSQLSAGAVLRYFTKHGADAGRIQAQGEVDASQKSRVQLIFSDVNGEFHPLPVENS